MMTPPGRPTHHAPPSPSSFKSRCFAAVAAASLLLVSALPASAISVSIYQDDATRVAFDVLWGEAIEIPSGSDVYTIFADPVDVAAKQVAVIWCTPGLLLCGWLVFHFPDDASNREFNQLVLLGFEGREALPIAGNPFGSRFVYGAPFDPPTGVPDNGAAALMLSAGLAGLTLLRRSVV